MKKQDLKTLGIVLKRINYGEADRILNLLTPEGRVTAMAKGVRKERSKMAGGIEMFCLSKMILRAGRGEFYTLTGVKLEKFYGKILKDWGRMELAGEILRKMNKIEIMDGREYFDLVLQCLEGLEQGGEPGLVRGWFAMNLARVRGEEMNLYRDKTGEKLQVGEKYDWDLREEAFYPSDTGRWRTDEIKMLRVLNTMKLGTVQKVKVAEETKERALELIKLVSDNR